MTMEIQNNAVLSQQLRLHESETEQMDTQVLTKQDSKREDTKLDKFEASSVMSTIKELVQNIAGSDELDQHRIAQAKLAIKNRTLGVLQAEGSQERLNAGQKIAARIMEDIKNEY